jgi:cyclin H
MPDVTEDDIYRASTQYRLWSFTGEALASLRSTTNATAAEGVRAAIKNVRSLQANTDAMERGNDRPVEVDCLTVEEEQRMVGYYCFKTMQFADHFKLGTYVKVIHYAYLTVNYSLTPTDHARLRPCSTSSAFTSRILP